MTESMQRTIDETDRRREKQINFNTKHNITPTTISKSMKDVFAQTSVLDIKGYDPADPHSVAPDQDLVPIAAEEQADYKTIPQLEKGISATKKLMEKAARDLDFMEAARLRDEMFLLQKRLETIKK